MRIKKFIELKFQLNLETLEEYEASNATNSVFATQQLCGLGKSLISPHLSGKVAVAIMLDTLEEGGAGR